MQPTQFFYGVGHSVLVGKGDKKWQDTEFRLGNFDPDAGGIDCEGQAGLIPVLG